MRAFVRLRSGDSSLQAVLDALQARPDVHVTRLHASTRPPARLPAHAAGSFDVYHEATGAVPAAFDGAVVGSIGSLQWLDEPGTLPAAAVRALDRRLPRALERSTVLVCTGQAAHATLVDRLGLDPARVVDLGDDAHTAASRAERLLHAYRVALQRATPAARPD